MRHDRLERAIEALRAVQAGAELDLRWAPTLEFWTVLAIEGYPALGGVVFGHPDIPDGHLAVTSPLLALAEDDGWARTVSRFYRLGRMRRGQSELQ